MASEQETSQRKHGSFFHKLAARAAEVDSLLCVGLDPHQSELGNDCNAAGLRAFCGRIIEATSGVALAYKPNSAFFEAFGAEGLAALKEVIADVPKGIPVVLDVKRGDIGSTAAAYASSCFKELKADCVTLNAYMGVDTITPFLEDHPGKGAFVLCKTSNPSSNQLQQLSVGSSGKCLFEEVASLCERWNTANNVGLVVGATDVNALARARAAAPGLWILAPGVGAQGADLEAACNAALDSTGLGLVVPVSRGISTAADPGRAAKEFRDRINVARQSCKARRSAEAGLGGGCRALLPYQQEFIEFALAQKVLRFGEFKLKSGRTSPYFFNAGLFCTGAALSRLASYYAEAIVRAQPPLQFDVIFGPAYKGIPLGASVALKLADSHGRDVGFAYNRKEAKDHGDKGSLVGAPMEGKRVLILDDVITAGTAIREAMEIIDKARAEPAGVVVALDRQERTGAKPQTAGEGNGVGEGGHGSRSNGEDMSAVQQIEQAFSVPVVSVVGLKDLTSFMAMKGDGEGGVDTKALEDLKAYRTLYGVE